MSDPPAPVALTADTSIYVPFAYKERAEDGALYVYGKVTGDELDLDEQIVDKDWARKALDEWFTSAANVRQMHSPHLPPAGKGIELEEKDDGFWLRSKIVEPGAQKLVEEDVYTGYSIGIKGPRVSRDLKAKNGRIVAGTIVENSLVDRPCLPSAKIASTEWKTAVPPFLVCKRAPDNTVEYVGKAVLLDTAAEQPAEKTAGAGDADPAISADSASDATPAAARGLDPKSAEGKSAIKRLHDLTCPAYHPADVLLAHPEIVKNGLALELGPEALRLVGQMLQHEVDEDGGQGGHAWDILNLANIYQQIASYVSNERWEAEREQLDDVLLTAICEARKGFEAAYPGVRLNPRDPGAASAFARSVLEAGHQAVTAPGGDKTPAKVASGTAASAFQRDAILAGHASPSPADDQVKDVTMRQALQQMHDNLAALKPGICPVGGHAGGPGLRTSATSGLQPVAGPGGATSSTVASTRLAAEPDTTKDTHAPEEGATDEGDALLTKAVEAAKAEAAQAATVAVEAAQTEAAELRKTVETLSARIEAMAAEPDPRTAAYRGPALPRPATTAIPAETAAAATEAADVLTQQALKELMGDIALLQRQAKSAPEFSQRVWAEQQLRDIQQRLQGLPAPAAGR